MSSTYKCYCFTRYTDFNKSCRYCIRSGSYGVTTLCTECQKIKNYYMKNHIDIHCEKCDVYVCNNCVSIKKCPTCKKPVKICRHCNTTGCVCRTCKSEGCKSCMFYNDYKEFYSCKEPCQFVFTQN